MWDCEDIQTLRRQNYFLNDFWSKIEPSATEILKVSIALNLSNAQLHSEEIECRATKEHLRVEQCPFSLRFLCSTRRRSLVALHSIPSERSWTFERFNAIETFKILKKRPLLLSRPPLLAGRVQNRCDWSAGCRLSRDMNVCFWKFRGHWIWMLLRF